MSNDFCGDPTVHDSHSWGILGWCDGISDSDVRDSDLMVDLNEALIANRTIVPCPACEAIASVSENVRGPLADALAGTIGRDKLVTILARHGYKVGRRAIERHRQEGHS